MYMICMVNNNNYRDIEVVILFILEEMVNSTMIKGLRFEPGQDVQPNHIAICTELEF